MLRLDQDLNLNEVPLDIYKDLVLELNKDDSWKILAKHISKKFECPSTWISNLQSATLTGTETPAERLLSELEIKMCTVGILSILLDNCNLPKVSSILHLPEPLEITVHPDNNMNSGDLYVVLGHCLQLKCAATGIPSPNYQWFHGDSLLQGQTSNKLDIPIESPSQEGLYKCQIYQENKEGERIEEKFTKPIFINIKPSPVVIEKQPPVFLEIKQDDCLILNCEAHGYPTPQFQWYRNNVKLDKENTHILRIDKFAAKDEGKYYCHVFNGISEKFTQPSMVSMELPRQKAVAKVALLIANGDYDYHEKLKTPSNDVARVEKILRNLGFYTICLVDLPLLQMKNAIQIFCDSLTEGVYGLFYFVGHGFKMQENYMLPTDAPIDFLRKDAISESLLLSLALKSNPALLLVILDMCQTFPQIESNQKIHEEIPLINEFKGHKNLRNLLQAYSTSSYRPSYERTGKEYGLYASHLCKYLDENIPVTRIFEQVGKSIDASLKGPERKQIPMFATTITKPYRLTDSILQGKLPESVVNLEKMLTFSNKVVDVNFQQSGIKCKAMISQYMKPYLNLIQVSLFDVDEKWEINFYNSVHSKRNNLFQSAVKNKCWLHSPGMNEGPLVISLLENGTLIGATMLEINKFVPPLLNKLY